MNGPAVIEAGFLIVAAILVCLPYTESADFFRDRLQDIGLQDAEIRHFPWQVGIYYQGELICGGAIIDNLWVLTAAHCIVGKKHVRVVEGVQKLEHYPKNANLRLAAVTVFRKNEYFFAEYDIGLLKMSTPFVWSDNVKPVMLPRRSHKSVPHYGDVVTLSGWGGIVHDENNYEDITSRTLQFSETEVKSHFRCPVNKYICTKSVFTEVDSITYGGGPLVWRDDGGINRVVGILSEADERTVKKGKMVTHMDKFTKVYHYLDWIEDNTEIKIEF